MARPLIALDFDDTLLDTFGSLIRHATALAYDCSGLETLGYRCLPDCAFQSFHNEESPSNTALVAGAREACAVLRAKGFGLTILTARQPVTREGTSKLVEAHLGDLIEDLVCVGYGGKSAALRALAPVLFIDDSPTHIAEADAEGIPAILFGNLPWNMSAPHAYRARSWTDTIPMALGMLLPGTDIGPRRN